MLTGLVLTVCALLAAFPLAALRVPSAASVAARLAQGAGLIVRAAFALAAACALLLVLAQIAVVICVSVFSVSVVWLQETAAYLFAAMFLLGAGGVFLADGHVRVDVLSSRWSERRRAQLDLTGITLFLLPVCALILIVSLPWAARSWAALERSGEPSGLHLVFVLKSFVPAFALLLALSGFVRAEAAAAKLRDR